MTNCEQLLCELIALPSVNPAFLPERHPHSGEGRIAEFLATVAARAGLVVEFQTVAKSRANLLARLIPSGKMKQRILLAPHLDTVDASDPQFKPRLRNGRIYGRGACDTKGSVAAMLTAVCELARTGRRPQHTEIVFAGLMDEEHAQAGARALSASAFRADLAIVGEPTRNQVVTAHKGSMWLFLETEGKAAHGSRPDLGVNAVHRMAQVVDFLETSYAERLRNRTHRLLGSASVSVGAITGGSQANIVPDHCAIQVDRRTLPGETDLGVIRELAGLLQAAKLKAKVSSSKSAPCLPLETDTTLPLVQQFLTTARQPSAQGMHYFCDASVLSAGGIPSVVFGPGDIAQAHTADEWIAARSLERSRQLLLAFLRSLP